MKKILALVIVLFLVPLSTSAQDFCEGNFDYDQDVDGSDAFTFKIDFGRSLLKNPCPPDGPAPVPKTGQSSCYDDTLGVIDCTGTGQDGEYQNGVTWPNPRFVDNNDGTITDNLTGLIWLKNANCFGQRTWFVALTFCNELEDGMCDLTDGSSQGDWRMPNVYELHSLIHIGYYDPALSNTTGTSKWAEGDPFTNVTSTLDGNHWTSTSTEAATDYVWYVPMYSGGMYMGGQKTNSYYVWPVRGGH